MLPSDLCTYPLCSGCSLSPPLFTILVGQVIYNLQFLAESWPWDFFFFLGWVPLHYAAKIHCPNPETQHLLRCIFAYLLFCLPHFVSYTLISVRTQHTEGGQKVSVEFFCSLEFPTKSMVVYLLLKFHAKVRQINRNHIYKGTLQTQRKNINW